MSIAIIPMSNGAWSDSTKGAILSSFFYGYICTQILGGYLSHRYGAKLVLGAGCFLWSIFTLIVPLVADNIPLLIISRIFLGAGEGIGFPAIHHLIATFIPPNEQSRAVAFVTACSYGGAIIAVLISQELVKSTWGWPSIFVVFGGLGLVWCAVWMWCASSSPTEGSFFGMTAQETEFLLSEGKERRLSDQFGTGENVGETYETPNSPFGDGPKKRKYRGDEFLALSDDAEDDPVDKELGLGFKIPDTASRSRSSISSFKETSKIPWKLIFSRKEVWAILVNQFCSSFLYYALLNWLPTYYNEVFHVDLDKIGWFSSVTYAVQGVVGLCVGFLGDSAIHTYKIRVITVRRVAQTIGLLVPALFLLLAAFAADSITKGVIFITCAMGFSSFTLIAVSVNQLDIAPKYAGIIFALGNTAATLSGFGVHLTGIILDQTHSWALVFGTMASFNVIGSIVWLTCAGAEVVIE